MANRHQVGDARHILCLDDRDRICSLRRRLVLGMAATRQPFSQSFAGSQALGGVGGHVLAAGLANRAAEGLRGAQWVAAGFALHREDRAEARIAGRATRPHLAGALRAHRRQLCFGVVEVTRAQSRT